LQLNGSPFFSKADHVNKAIQDVVALLRVPRCLLGITCASKGAVHGKLLVKDHPAAAWQDCMLLGNGGKAIPGEVAAIQQLSFRLVNHSRPAVCHSK
jgi:DNA topoisomerase VI subunit A